MQVLLYVGVIVFFTGLVMSHIVVGLTRGAVRSKKPMKKLHRVLMWSSVGLVLIGVILAGLGYYFMSS